MRRTSLWRGALLGLLSGVAVVALFFLGNQLFRLPNPVYDLFEWMTRILPGKLVTFGIDTMVALLTRLGLGPTSAAAKLAEKTIAVTQFAGGGLIFGFFLALLGRRSRARPAAVGAAVGALLAALSVFVASSRGVPGIIWLALVYLGWGMLLGHAVGRTAPLEPGEAPSRRGFLKAFAGAALALSAAALGLGRLLGMRRAAAPPPPPSTALTEGTSGPAASPPADVLASRIEATPGTRPEITANANFYRIDINLKPPELDGGAFRLAVGGLVDRPLSLSLADLRARPAQSQLLTMQCISNPVGGDLTGTTRWTGVKLKDVLAEAGLRGSPIAIQMEAADGFYESLPMTEAMDDRTLLVYDMNGVPLPTEHGFPLRIYIPDHYGMKQPKWLQKLTIMDKQGAGFWVDRGWSQTAIIKTTSVIDAVHTGMMMPEKERTPGSTLPVGGIAFAGARGVSKVEVQVDEGPWVAAQLRAPALSPLTWVQWRYDWPYQPGKHRFRVRATDGTGALQAVEERPPHPDGASGLYEKTVML